MTCGAIHELRLGHADRPSAGRVCLIGSDRPNASLARRARRSRLALARRPRGSAAIPGRICEPGAERAAGPPGEPGLTGARTRARRLVVDHPWFHCRRASGGSEKDNSARICRFAKHALLLRYQYLHDRVSHPATTDWRETHSCWTRDGRATTCPVWMRCGESKEATGGTMRLEDPAGRSFSLGRFLLASTILFGFRFAPIADRWRCGHGIWDMEKQHYDSVSQRFLLLVLLQAAWPLKTWNLQCLPPERVGRSSFPA